MRNENKCDAIIIISCKKEQVLAIIEYVKARFPEVEVNYEVLREEIL
ncbi:MAG: hypothetical protein QXT26_07770 [Thermoproteota archaeon]